MTCAFLLALLLSAAPAQAQTAAVPGAATASPQAAAPEQTAAEKRASWLKRKAAQEEANRIAAEKRADWLRRKAVKEAAGKNTGQAPAQAASAPAPEEASAADADAPAAQAVEAAPAQQTAAQKRAAWLKRKAAKEAAAKKASAGKARKTKTGKLEDLSNYAQEQDAKEATQDAAQEDGGAVQADETGATPPSAQTAPAAAAGTALPATTAAPAFRLNYKPVAAWDQAVEAATADSGAKRFAQALARISTITASGYPPALLAAGRIYLAQGDNGKALSFTRAAAAKDYTPALLDMANYCFKGLGDELDKNEQDGLAWLERAANEGYAPAILQMAEARRDGLYGTDADPEQALRWYVKAAEQGDAFSEYLVAMAYKNGYGTAPDMDQAVRWLRRSAARKNPKAMAALGYCYKEGLGVEQDYDKALYYFKAGDINGDPQGLFALAQMYDQGLGVQQDDDTAARYYAAAGNAGYREAFTHLADSCYDAKDFPCAIRNYERCGTDGDPHCQYRMCLMFWASQSTGSNSVASAYSWCYASVQLGGGNEPQRLFYQISNYNFLGRAEMAAAKKEAERILKSSREFNARRKQVAEGKLPPGILKYKPLPDENQDGDTGS